MCHRNSIMVFVLMALALGCEALQYDLTKATRPYPIDLRRAEAVDIQVFREGNSLEIINSTPHSYRDFDLWINQRYVRHVELMAAGELIRLSLEEFYDERGEVFNAGGLLRTQEPMPVRLIEMQLSEDRPLIGLIAIRAEPAE